MKKKKKVKKAKGLEENLVELNEHMAKANSLGRAFVIGILKGLGVALGATLVLGLLVTLLLKTIQTVEDIPIINDFVKELRLGEVVEKIDKNN